MGSPKEPAPRLVEQRCFPPESFCVPENPQSAQLVIFGTRHKNANMSHVRTACHLTQNPLSQHLAWCGLRDETWFYWGSLWGVTEGPWKPWHLAWTLRDEGSWNLRKWGRRKDIFRKGTSLRNGMKREKYAGYLRNRNKFSLGNRRYMMGWKGRQSWSSESPQCEAHICISESRKCGQGRLMAKVLKEE